MKFINDVTHAHLLTINDFKQSKEPLRFRNLVLVFCDSGELFFELNYSTYTLKENGFLIITPFDILTFEKVSSDFSSTVLVLPSEICSPILKDINLLNFKYIKQTPVIYLQNEYLALYKQILSTLWHIKEVVADDEFDKIANDIRKKLQDMQQAGIASGIVNDRENPTGKIYFSKAVLGWSENNNAAPIQEEKNQSVAALPVFGAPDDN